MSVDGENERCIGIVVHQSVCFIRIHLRAQAPIHEASFLERHPPLAWLACSIRVQFLDKPSSKFLADLHQILAKVVYVVRMKIFLPFQSAEKNSPASARDAGGA